MQVSTLDGKKYLGEIVRVDSYRPTREDIAKLPVAERAPVEQSVSQSNGTAERRLLKIGNIELTQTAHTWLSSFEIKNETQPVWALIIERATNDGRFYGNLSAYLIDGKVATQNPAEAWAEYQKNHDAVRRLVLDKVHLEKEALGKINRTKEVARLAIRQAELTYGANSSQQREAVQNLEQVNKLAEAELKSIDNKLIEINKELQRQKIRLTTADGKTKDLALGDIVRAYPANQLSFFDKLSIYGSRWYEFIFDNPRNVNTEGGVFPAIWGTLTMTILMSILVVPFGVLAALYLREYARPGPLVTSIRIAVNNLAGVPSIVFGVFGLGFFCYILGGSVDQLFFTNRLPSPTFGTGGILWASLTLALLTVPVIIVSTEEALAAVPRSMREGSYACGASKWQTIRRIILPRAMPGILTGMILAMARGAGEVAPLMLVGAMKLAPELPVDTVFPFVHPERSFMHLGFHIYDVGFQSPDSESAKPMVFTTTLLLICLIGVLNLAAMWLRNRLRKHYQVTQF